MPNMINQLQDTGSFTQITPLFDAEVWRSTSPTSEQFKDLMVLLHQQINQMAVVLNLKETGYYLTLPFNNSNQWFNPANNDPLQLRPEYTVVVIFGTLNAGVTTMPHGLIIPAGSTLTTTYIGGSATDSVGLNFWPIPASGPTYISVVMDATNVIINNQSGIVFTSAYIVIKFLEY